MHMSDALLSPAVALTMCAAAGGAVAYSAAKLKKNEFSEKKLPLTAIAGAFVFAAQMINFTIPGTGSSGHIGGGILLAALVGGDAALLAVTAVLVIQALFFADGGLLALGCNIFNMGVIPCLVVYPLVFTPMLKSGVTRGRLAAASIASALLALQAGAFSVVLETTSSGITALPFSTFVMLMQPIHLAIGLVEGLVTGAVLSFVWKAQPELPDFATASSESRPMKRVLALFAALALLCGAILSSFASSYPDGLEWSILKVTGKEELEASGEIFDRSAALQQRTAVMPDYDFAEGEGKGTAAAGVIGSAATFVLAAAVCALVSRSKKKGLPN